MGTTWVGGQLHWDGGTRDVAGIARRVRERVRRGTGNLQRVSDYDCTPVARVWGFLVAGWVIDVYLVQYRWRSPPLARWRVVESIGNAESGTGCAVNRKCGDAGFVFPGLEGGDAFATINEAASRGGGTSEPHDRAGIAEGEGGLPSIRLDRA